MKHWTLGVSAIALGLGMAVPASAHDDVTAWRLFVSDHGEGVVNVIDAEDGDLLGTITLDGPATLHRTTSGETVFAVQGNSGAVQVIASGIAFHDHGDHADIEVEDATLLDARLDGEKPAHFVERQGLIAQWYDGESEARFFTESSVHANEAAIRTVDVGAAHHGVAVPYQNHAVVTIPNPEDASQRPVGARVVDFAGNQVGEDIDCPGLHGSAGSGNLYALACHTGLLVISKEGGEPQVRHVAYPDSLPEGNSSTLLGGRGLQYFIGNYGADRIVVVDPTEADGFQLVQLPTRRVHFVVDPIRPRFAYVFTEDGQLHKVDVLSAEIVSSLRVTDPYSMDGHWADPRPRLAVAGGNVVVTDPLNGVLHLVNAESFEESGEITVEGRPFNIVAVGGSGVVHGEGEEGHSHSHGHDHDDGHAHNGHSHSHDHGDPQIYAGYFEDSQIADRPLSDYEGDWQSVYPYLEDGTLDPVWEHKAEEGDMSAEEYAEYYEIGYRTDVERIVIEDDTVTFYEDGRPVEGRYAYDGYEVLTYAKGNRGVRFIFAKTEGDDAAPQFIQFSDHRIAPEKTDHYHLYWGDDRAALLEEVTNWPTYYPSSLNADEIVSEMIAH